jgi:hypothetical protein
MHAQDSIKTSKPKTIIDSMSDISGSIIKREFTYLNTFYGCEIDVIKVTKMNIRRDSALGLFFQMSGGSYVRSSYAVSLDERELTWFFFSLQYMEQKIKEPLPKSYTEYAYASDGDFKVGIYSKRNAWGLYMQLDKYYSKSRVEMNINDLPKLISLFEEAQKVISRIEY